MGGLQEWGGLVTFGSSECLQIATRIPINQELQYIWMILYARWGDERHRMLQEEETRQNNGENPHALVYIDFHNQFPSEQWLLGHAPYSLYDYGLAGCF